MINQKCTEILFSFNAIGTKSNSLNSAQKACGSVGTKSNPALMRSAMNSLRCNSPIVWISIADSLPPAFHLGSVLLKMIIARNSNFPPISNSQVHLCSQSFLWETSGFSHQPMVSEVAIGISIDSSISPEGCLTLLLVAASGFLTSDWRRGVVDADSGAPAFARRVG